MNKNIKQIVNDFVKSNHKKIDEWFEYKLQGQAPIFYNSVDIRDSGYKIVPVDTNIFPAGFNNLTEDSITFAINEVKSFFNSYYGKASNILLLTENHTKNFNYFSNIATLQKILNNALQKQIYISSEQKIIIEDELKLFLKELEINFFEYEINNNEVIVNGEKIDLVVLNHDLSYNEYKALSNLNIPVIPSPKFGWYKRTKSAHFESYMLILDQFCKEFKLDSFLFAAEQEVCKNIDFKSYSNLECLALNSEKLIKRLKEKYSYYKIQQDPYLFVKANQGTYGMGIMVVKTPEELLNLNKKDRNKMQTIKGGKLNSEVLIQEGVPSIISVNNNTAEPFMYSIAGKPIGIIYRVNEIKDNIGNLNSKGMYFKKEELSDDHLAYRLIARLASLAVLYEE